MLESVNFLYFRSSYRIFEFYGAEGKEEEKKKRGGKI